MSYVSVINLDKDLCSKPVSKITPELILVQAIAGDPSDYFKFQVFGKIGNEEIILTPYGGWYFLNYCDSIRYEVVAYNSLIEKIYFRSNKPLHPECQWCPDGFRRVPECRIDSGYYSQYFKNQFSEPELDSKVNKFRKQFNRVLQNNMLKHIQENFWDNSDKLNEKLEFILCEGKYKLKSMLKGATLSQISDLYNNILDRIFPIDRYFVHPEYIHRSALELRPAGNILMYNKNMEQYKEFIQKGYSEYVDDLEKAKKEAVKIYSNIANKKNEKNYLLQYTGHVYTVDKVNRILGKSKNPNTSII